MARSLPNSPSLSPSSSDPTSTLPPPPSSLESLDKEDLILLIERLKDEFVKSQEKIQSLEEERELRNDRDGSEDEGEERGNGSRETQRELEGVREREEEWRREQMRMEEESAGRIEVLDKLRGTVRELEKDKRESTKRYREQADSFDSERQSWYDQEQHYKIRISNLSEERKKKGRLSAGRVRPQEADSDALHEIKEDALEEEPKTPTTRSSFNSERELTASPAPSTTSDSSPTPNEIALRAQLDSLSTAHTSLTTTLRTLQTEMTDLKRVYQDLQEENESYEILLGEKTLSGEVTGTDFFRKSFSWGEGGNVGSPNGGVQGGWSGFGFQGGLEAVGEEDGLESEEDEDEYSDSSDDEGEEDIEKILLESKGIGSVNSGAVSAQSPTRKRRSSRRSKSIALAHAKRDSTSSSFPAGVGGGLDLAAELEMAQKEDELDEVEIERKREKEEKRLRKKEERERKKREARAARRDGSQSMPIGIEDLHLEIKQLREANKALTLYVSKIVDRVCSQEGFEKVLAVDYRNNGNTPKADNSSSPQPDEPATPQPDPPAAKKARPVSTSFFSRSPNPQKEPSTPKTATSTGLAPTPSSASSVGSTATTSNGPRKSGGLSWDGISSVFGFGSSTPSNANTLSPAAPITQNLTAPGMRPLMLSNEARRLSISDEDEDDILQRERLRVDLSRHGIDYAPTLAQIGRPRSSSATPSPLPSPPSALTLDPIEEAEKQLQAREKEEETIRQQMKEGKGSGLTDAPPRRMNKLERRHSSRGSSISYNISPSSSQLAIAGLGIESPSPTVTSGSVSPAEGQKGSELRNEGEQQQGWTKALRRMSKGWTSPPVN